MENKEHKEFESLIKIENLFLKDLSEEILKIYDKFLDKANGKIKVEGYKLKVNKFSKYLSQLEIDKMLEMVMYKFEFNWGKTPVSLICYETPTDLSTSKLVPVIAKPQTELIKSISKDREGYSIVVVNDDFRNGRTNFLPKLSELIRMDKEGFNIEGLNTQIILGKNPLTFTLVTLSRIMTKGYSNIRYVSSLKGGIKSINQAVLKQ